MKGNPLVFFNFKVNVMSILSIFSALTSFFSDVLYYFIFKQNFYSITINFIYSCIPPSSQLVFTLYSPVFPLFPCSVLFPIYSPFLNENVAVFPFIFSGFIIKSLLRNKSRNVPVSLIF